MIDEDTSKLKIILGAIATFAVIALVAFLVTYRDTQVVTIDDRRWRYEVAVKYDRTTTTTECDTDSKGRTTCSPHTTTTTYTRCRSGLQGNSLPIVRPELACAMYSGDYVRETISYDVFYHTDNGQSSSSSFDGSQWDNLRPHSVVKLTTTAFNYAVGIEAKGQ